MVMPGTGGVVAPPDDGGPPANPDGGPATTQPTCTGTPGTGAVSPTFMAWKGAMNTHPNIPNVSWAGYHDGEVPGAFADWMTYDVTATFGAKGDGTTDDTAAIKQAVAKASADVQAGTARGAVVAFPGNANHTPRVYLMSEPLFVGQSHVVLRGGGTDAAGNAAASAVVIEFQKSLNTSYAISSWNATESSWSWQGGMIWFGPPSVYTYWSATNPKKADIGPADGLWKSGPTIGTITGSPKRGASQIKVTPSAAAAALKPGQPVVIEMKDSGNRALGLYLASGGVATGWAAANAGDISYVMAKTLQWVVRVDAVADDGTITLHQPLRFDVTDDWSPTVRALPAMISEIGIEHMTVRLRRDYTWTTATHHLERGWNGVYFNNAIDGFARDVAVMNADGLSFGTTAAKNITFSDIVLDSDASRLPGGVSPSTQHHGTVTRYWSDDVLIQRFTVRVKPLHGINIETESMGNVWSQGKMDHGTFDSHLQLPYENVRTEITINNDGQHGGPAASGPLLGARHVNWNVALTGGMTSLVASAGEMPAGALVGVTLPGGGNASPSGDTSNNGPKVIVENLGTPNPPNLYLAQRACRLSAVSPSCAALCP
jgi:hypothetical protein